MRSLLLVVALFGASIDPRLATIQKVQVVAVDPLSADQQVAVCFEQHLKLLSLETVTSKDDADVIMKIIAVVSPTTRIARVRVELPSGEELWKGTASWTGNTLRNELALGGIECTLADDLLRRVRDVMRKARDK